VIDLGRLWALQRQIRLNRLGQWRAVILTSERLARRDHEPDEGENQYQGEAPCEDLASEPLEDA